KKKKKKPHLRALPNLPILTRRRPPPPSLPPTARGAPTLLPIAAAVPNHRRRPGCAATTRRPAPRQTAPRALRPNHLCRLHTPATLFPSTAPCRQAPAPERHRPPTGHYSGASPRARAPIPYSHQPPELCRPGNNAAPERCPGPRTADSRRPWISSATTRQYTPRLLSQPSPGPLPLPIAAVVPVYLNLSFSSGSRASIPTPKGSPRRPSTGIVLLTGDPPLLSSPSSLLNSSRTGWALLGFWLRDPSVPTPRGF
uniref:Uncharacterized protein n=5 Tax=Aegilops tauschii subsp. strangulata TaxID=200361 RepID=A0A453K4A3_AEGTS